MKCDKCDNEAVRTSLNSHLCADHLFPQPLLNKICPKCKGQKTIEVGVLRGGKFNGKHIECPECEGKGTLLPPQPLDDKELREKIDELCDHIEMATIAHSEIKHEGLLFYSEELDLHIDYCKDQILALLQQKCKECEYDPQAAEFGWFLRHGWTSPAELQPKIEEERERIQGRIQDWGKTCSGF